MGGGGVGAKEHTLSVVLEGPHQWGGGGGVGAKEHTLSVVLEGPFRGFPSVMGVFL